MANDKKFVVKNGLQANNVAFVNESNATNIIEASMLSTDTLSFSGNSGQLFSISDTMSGVIFGVNDVSGIPSIEVDDTGDVRLAEFSGNVSIGTSLDTHKLYVQGNAVVNGTMLISNLVATDINVSGNLTVSGTTTYINSTALNIGDSLITLNADLPSGTAPTENAGIEINRGSAANVQFLWDETNDRWSTNTQPLAAGSIRSSQSVTIGTGGTYEAGSIYSDASWGMIFRAKQASPSAAQYRWANSADGELMRIDTGGNLLLGRTSALAQAYRLLVEGDSALTAVPMGINDARSGTTDSRILSFRRGGTETGYITSTDALMSVAGSSTLAFQTAGFEQMRITNVGNLGVGTIDPTYRAHISTSSTNALGVYRDLDVTSVGAAGQLIEIGARNGSTFTPGASITGVLNNPATSGSLSFETRSAGALGTRMTINSSGNLLLGTASNYTRLTVSNGNSTRSGITISDTNTASLMLFAGASAGAVISTDAIYQDLIFKRNSTAGTENGTETMRINSSGNVGIGTDSPTARLHVIGNARIGQITDNTTAARLDITAGGSGSDSIIDLGYWGTFDAAIWHIKRHGADNTFRIAYAGGGSEDPVFVLNSSGNLGLGNVSPISRLHVTEANKGFNNYGNINVFTNDTAAADIGGSIAFGGRNTTGGTTPYVFGKIQGIKEGSASSWNGALLFGTTAGTSAVEERMRLTSTGDLAIGTVGNLNTTSKLRVRQTGSTEVLELYATTTTKMTLANDNNLVAIQETAGGGMDLMYNAAGTLTSGLRLSHSGNIGIGTVSPSQRLDVSTASGTEGVGLAITNSQPGGYGSGVNFYSFRTDGTTKLASGAIRMFGQSNWADATNTSSNMRFYTVSNNTLDERMRIEATGSLLIGRTTSSGLGQIQSTVGADLATDSGNVYMVRSGGSVAVGTTTLNSILTLARSTSTATPAATPSIILSNRNTSINGTIAAGLFMDTYRDVSNPHYSGGIWFTRNQTAGNLSSSSDIVFGTMAEGSTGLPTPRMRLTAAGNLGIATDSPVGRLSVSLGSATSSGATAGLGSWDNTYVTFGDVGVNSNAVAIGYNSTTGGSLISLAPSVDWRRMNYLAQEHRFYSTGAAEAFIINSSRQLRSTAPMVAWNTTTPGTGVGGLHLGSASTTSNAGSAITFGARDGGNEGTAQAGIYINSDGTYGTKMYLATSNDYGAGSKTGLSIDHVGIVSAPRDSMRAKIFYDVDEPAYFLDPNSTGTSLNVRGEINTPAVWISDGDNFNNYNENIRLRNASNGVTTIAFDAAGTGGIPVSSILGFSDRHEVRWGSNWQTRVRNGYAEAAGSYRAPLFYDTDDTAFFIDPASTTTSLQVAGTIEQGNNYAHPNIEWAAGGNTTGEIIFYLPGVAPTNYGMVHMVFDIYEYITGKMATVIVGGHNWTTAWYNNTCQVIGWTDKTVRLGVKNDGTNNRYCVVFGGVASSWTYATIRLRKIHNASFYNNVMDLGGNWSAFQTTTEEFVNITGDLRNLRTPSDMVVDGNLGIGTTSPDARLDVLGASGDQIRLRTAETEDFRIGRNSSTGYLNFYGSQSGYTGYTFGGVDGTHMTINAGGQTEINSTSDYQLLLSGRGTSWAGILFSDSSNSDPLYYNGSTRTFSIGGSGAAVTNKMLHIHGGVTIGSGLQAGAVSPNSLVIEGSAGFGSSTRQMINLWGTIYGIGVQSSTSYFRTDGRFSWFRGGVHSDSENTAGSGGTVAMTLDASSNLNVTGTVYSISGIDAYDSAAGSDPYGKISVTRTTASNWSYYGLTRAGQLGMGMGINTSNQFFIGGMTAGYNGVLSGSAWLTLTTGGVLTALSESRGTLFRDSVDTAYFLDPGATESAHLRGTLRFGDYGAGVVGLYDSYKYQLVYAMGDSYKGALDGTNVTSGYGLWWSHPNAGGPASNLTNHGLMCIVNGNFFASLDASTQAITDMRAPLFYDRNDTTYYIDPNGTSYLNLQYTNRYFQRASGVPTNNLGDPTVTEMALFQEQFNNKTEFYPIANVKFYTSTDGSTWTEYTSFSDTEKRKFLGGNGTSGINIPNGTPYFRIEVLNSGAYVFLNALYMYWSGNSHSTTVKIRARNGAGVWEQWTNSSVQVSSWPGHLYLPFNGIPFLAASSGHYSTVHIDFQPTWSTGIHASNVISLYNMQIWGGYPAGKRTIYSVDEVQNTTFPAEVSSTVFRDSNNSAYFVDPSSTSVLSVMRADTIQRNGGNQAILLNNGTYTQFCDPAGTVKFWIGGSDAGNYFNNSTHYFRNTASTNQFLIYGDGSRRAEYHAGAGSLLIYGDAGGWGMGTYFVGSSGTNRGGFGALGSADTLSNFWIGTSNSSPAVNIFTDGRVEAIASHRAPIFYNIPNTAYYIDGEGTSVLNIINATDIYMTGGGWLRSYGEVGVYSQSYGQHFYPDAGGFYWEVDGPLRIRDGYEGTIKGYVGFHDGAGFGQLTGGGSWWLNTPDNPAMLVIGGSNGVNAFNSNTSRRLMLGGGDTDAQTNYYIGTNQEDVGGNYNKLDLRWHTGIRMGAQSMYGGIRLYDSEDLGTVQWQFNGSSGYGYKYVWLYTNTTGIYSDTNGAHFHPNGTTTYGQWYLQGSKGSYGGITDAYSGVSWMHDSGGNGGMYREASGIWYYYYHVANSCLGVSGSTTSSSYDLYVSGAIYATSDIVAYSDVRKKENIITIESALDKVNQLRGVYYNKIGETARKTGVIAQEVNEVLPEVVTYADDVDEYGVNYGNFAGVFIEAIKELTDQVNALKKEIEELKNGSAN